MRRRPAGALLGRIARPGCSAGAGAKRAQVALVREWARRTRGSGIACQRYAPGLSEIGNGRLYLDRRPRAFDRAPVTRLSAAERRRLWDTVVQRTGGVDPVRSGEAQIAASGV